MPAYSHLLDEERDQIAVMRAAGRSIWAIARALQRAKSTVSRKLRRNGLSSRRYSPLHAAGAYQLRRRREAIIEKDQKLRTFVCDRLAEGWTPEQIAGWLKAGNERRLRAVGCETIYAFIYRPYQKAERLWRYLTRRHKRRRPRRSRPSRDTIKDRVSIHERPKTIDTRTEAAANGVIDLAAERFIKNLWTDRNSAGRPHLVSVCDEADCEVRRSQVP
jgi:transposase, IS30 family